MRKIYNYRTKQESFWEMLHAKRFNPCLEITFRDKSGKHTHKLSAGAFDILDVYREGNETYILSTHHKLGYVGLEAFDGPDKIGSIFLEAHQVKEILGRDDLAPFNAIKLLREHIM